MTALREAFLVRFREVVRREALLLRLPKFKRCAVSSGEAQSTRAMSAQDMIPLLVAYILS